MSHYIKGLPVGMTEDFVINYVRISSGLDSTSAAVVWTASMSASGVDSTFTEAISP